MLFRTAAAARRKTLFSRTLVLTALLVIAAAGSFLGSRSARADAPIMPLKKDALTEATPEAQAVARLLAAQSVGNPALGASFMQVLWGGGKDDEPPKGNVTRRPAVGPMNLTPQRVVPARIAPGANKRASVK